MYSAVSRCDAGIKSSSSMMHIAAATRKWSLRTKARMNAFDDASRLSPERARISISAAVSLAESIAPGAEGAASPRRLSAEPLPALREEARGRSERRRGGAVVPGGEESGARVGVDARVE